MLPPMHFLRSGLVGLLAAFLILIIFGGYWAYRNRSVSRGIMDALSILDRWQFWCVLFALSLWQHLLDDGLGVSGYGMSIRLLWLPLFVWLNPILIFHFLFYSLIIFAIIMIGSVFVKWLSETQKEHHNWLRDLEWETRSEDDWFEVGKRDGDED